MKYFFNHLTIELCCLIILNMLTFVLLLLRNVIFLQGFVT